jgi:hypothetical protein
MVFGQKMSKTSEAPDLEDAYFVGYGGGNLPQNYATYTICRTPGGLKILNLMSLLMSENISK